jgi:hypothetical protein
MCIECIRLAAETLDEKTDPHAGRISQRKGQPMKKIILAAALMTAAPAMACETAGGPHDRALEAEYDQVRRQYDTARAGVIKSMEDGSEAAAEIYQQRVVALEARAAQLRMMWIDAQKGC